MNYYVYQHPYYAIGNFIYCTPSIKILYDHFNEKVPVLFSSESVSSLFLESKLIRPINAEEAEGKTLICSSDWAQDSSSYSHLINRDNSNLQQVADKHITISDWEHLAHKTMKELGISRNIPSTFVDEVEKPKEINYKKYCVILRGCATHMIGRDGQGTHFNLKDPGIQIYKDIIKDLNRRAVKIVFLGAEDNENNISEMAQFAEDPIIILNDMRKSLGAINHATFVVSNDTGLYHAAAALNKKAFVIWKNTPFFKNRSPGKNTTYSQNGSWLKDYENWI